MALETISKDVDRLQPGDLVLSSTGTVFLVLGYERKHLNEPGSYRLLDSRGEIDYSMISIMRYFQWKRLCRDENEER